MAPRRRWLKRLVALGVGVLLAVVMAEIVLRFSTVDSPVWATADEHCGLRLRAGADGVFTAEGVAEFRINSAGWREREIAAAKPANTLRVAVLGDSFTAAFHVPMDSSFTRVLEDELARSASSQAPRVEVLNFGVPGFGTGQALQALRHYVRDYEPDIVLLAFFAANDVADNSRALSGAAYRPYFVERDGELILDDSFLRDPAYLSRSDWKAKAFIAMSDYSRIVQIAAELRRGRRVAGQTEQVQDRRRAGLTSTIYAEPQTDVWRDAWRVTERLIVTMRDEARAQGAKFGVVQIADAIQVHPELAERREFMTSLGLKDLSYPGARIKEACARAGIPCLDLARPMGDSAAAQGVHYHGFDESLGGGHWNEAGHRVAGRVIAQWLASDGAWQ